MADEIPPSRYTSIAPYVVDLTETMFPDQEKILRGFFEHLLDRGLNVEDFAPGPSKHAYAEIDGQRRMVQIFPVLHSNYPPCPMCDGLGRIAPKDI